MVEKWFLLFFLSQGETPRSCLGVDGQRLFRCQSKMTALRGVSRRLPACVRCLKWVALDPEHELRCFVEGDGDDDDVLDVNDIVEDDEPPPRCTRCWRLNKPCEMAVSVSAPLFSIFEQKVLVKK